MSAQIFVTTENKKNRNMETTNGFVAVCKVCGGHVYYYPMDIHLEMKTINLQVNTDLRTVDAHCEENKHHGQYKFPDDFKPAE